VVTINYSTPITILKTLIDYSMRAQTLIQENFQGMQGRIQGGDLGVQTPSSTKFFVNLQVFSRKKSQNTPFCRPYKKIFKTPPLKNFWVRPMQV